MGARARVHRMLALAVVVTAAALAFAPMLFGPAMPYVMRVLGVEHEHKCACGMKAGTCACPECARLEQQRTEEREPTAAMVIKSSCDDDGRVPMASALPHGVVPGGIAEIAILTVEAPRVLDRARAPSNVDLPPPTPPPRLARV